MSDDEAEVWAEELTRLVEHEEARNDSKLQSMTQDLNKGTPDILPQSMAPKFPSELFAKLPPPTHP